MGFSALFCPYFAVLPFLCLNGCCVFGAFCVLLQYLGDQVDLSFLAEPAGQRLKLSREDALLHLLHSKRP